MCVCVCVEVNVLTLALAHPPSIFFLLSFCVGYFGKLPYRQLCERKLKFTACYRSHTLHCLCCWFLHFFWFFFLAFSMPLQKLTLFELIQTHTHKTHPTNQQLEPRLIQVTQQNGSQCFCLYPVMPLSLEVLFFSLSLVVPPRKNLIAIKCPLSGKRYLSTRCMATSKVTDFERKRDQ